MRILRRIRDILREEGIYAVFLKTLKRVVHLIYYNENYLIFSRSTKKINNIFYSNNNSIVIFTNSMDIKDDSNDVVRALGTLRNTLDKHIASGGMFFCVMANKTIAHQSWVATRACRTVDPIARYISYEHVAYIGRCQTSPNFRGKGLYPQVLSAICDVLAAKGVEEAMLTVLPDNYSSISGIKKAGFREKGKGRLDVFLGIFFWKEL